MMTRDSPYTLVHELDTHRGSQWVVFVATVVYKSQQRSVRELNLSGGC